MIKTECLMFPILRSDLSNKEKTEENMYNNIRMSKLIINTSKSMYYISKEDFFHKYPYSIELIEYINKKINELSDQIKTNYCSRCVSYSSNRVFMYVNINKKSLRVTFLGVIDDIKDKIIDISSDITPMNGQVYIYNKKDFDYLYETIKYSYELSLSRI